MRTTVDMYAHNEGQGEPEVSRSQRVPRTMLEHLIQQRDSTYDELAREFSKLDGQRR